MDHAGVHLSLSKGFMVGEEKNQQNNSVEIEATLASTKVDQKILDLKNTK